MGVGTGMRGKDLQKFLMVARDMNVIILVRHTNDDSLKYVQKPGYYPKPAVVKAKTADKNPPHVIQFLRGKKHVVSYDVSGLVVHPGFQPDCFATKKKDKALGYWNDTMTTLSPSLLNSVVDLNRPDSWSTWGVERKGVLAPRWSWRVDVNPESTHFGCLQLNNGASGWCYIHGDYDLKDVIVRGQERDNRRHEGKMDGVKNFTPLLNNIEFEHVRTRLNALMGVEMVQHGAEAQFAWHGDEPITVAFPDWRHLLLYDAMTVQAWYQNLNRDVLAKVGEDYLNTRSRMFLFGNNGVFAPGANPAGSWG